MQVSEIDAQTPTRGQEHALRWDIFAGLVSFGYNEI